MEELERTKSIAAEFGRPGGKGEKLQKLLEKRAEEKDNWVSNLQYYYDYSLSSFHFLSCWTGGVVSLILATDCLL